MDVSYSDAMQLCSRTLTINGQIQRATTIKFSTARLEAPVCRSQKRLILCVCT